MPKVLLVEDDHVLREAYTLLFKAHNYNFDAASNGKEALALCKKNHYAVILLDLMMPVLDGVGFLERAMLAKNAPRTRIVLLSNLSSGENLARALELGAHRQIVKSDLAPSEMVDLVDEELQLGA